VQDQTEFSSRIHSFNTNLLSKRFRQTLTVIQRHKDGTLHAHIVVVCDRPLGGALYWHEKRKRMCRRVTGECREEWLVFNPAKMKGYGLGVANLMPLQGDAESLGRYVARYVARELGTRKSKDKQARLVRYSQSWARVVYGPFSSCDCRAKRARKRAVELADTLWEGWGDMVRDLGPKWKWHLVRFLYCNDNDYERLLRSAERDLDFFGGPKFALDSQLASLEADKLEWKKDEEWEKKVEAWRRGEPAS
jgi:hypothetical protein